MQYTNREKLPVMLKMFNREQIEDQEMIKLK